MSSRLLKVGWRVGGGKFAGLGWLPRPGAVAQWAVGRSAGQGTDLPGRDLPLLGQPAHGVSQGLAQLAPLDAKLLTCRRIVHRNIGADAQGRRHRFGADRQPHRHSRCTRSSRRLPARSSHSGAVRCGRRRPVSSPSNPASSTISTAGPANR